MTNKLRRRLDNMLGADLGRNPYGEALYAWRHAATLVWPQRICDSNGRPEWDYKADPVSGLILPTPVFKLRMLCPALGDQWVMTLWGDPGSPEAWLKAFGQMVEYPSRGLRMPVSHRSGYVCLDPGVEPNEAITEAFIQEMKIQRNKRLVDHVADGESILERREREADRILTDRIDDIIGPYMSVPGKRGYHVSFPDPAIQARG